MVLFGGELELNDIKRCISKNQRQNVKANQMQTPFVIVPLTRSDFKKMSDPYFLQLLACFGIIVNLPGHVYPQVDSSVQLSQFEESIKLMQETLDSKYNFIIEKEKVQTMDVSAVAAAGQEEDEE